MDNLQEWKDKQNRYLIVRLVVFMFLGAIVGAICAASLDEALGGVFCGAFFGAVFAVIAYFFKISIDPCIEPWRQFCSEIGAELVREKSFFNDSCKVVAKSRDWAIMFDALILTSSSYFPYMETRVKASFVSKDGFRFKIYQSGLFSETRKLLGMQDIETGHPMFDLSFVIESNDKSKVRELFADTKIRQLIQVQPSIELGIKTSSSKGMDELYFLEENNIIRDVKQLKALYELFAEILNKLHHMGSA